MGHASLDNLDRLSNRELLRLRFCDLSSLKDRVEATRLGSCVAQLHAELAEAGLKHLRPRVYFGDEWFSPEGLAAIAVPFYLAHPRLTVLEQTMMTAVEGGSRESCMQLLRHEAGHCFDHAYGISQTPLWRQIFGARPSRYAPDVYLPDPASRAYVRHLPDFYAQAHPDEDFAETFAVVVTPGLDWRRRYGNWPVALAKCAAVEDLLQRYGPRRPRVQDEDCFAARRKRSTLARHYERRLAERAAAHRAVKKLAQRTEAHPTR